MAALSSPLLLKAEGYLELGMIDEAWMTLDNLPREQQVIFPVLALRVEILLAAKTWEKAELLADSLVMVMPNNAGVWYALAQAQAQQGQLEKARTSLKRACTLNDDLRAPALENALLAEVW